MPTSANHPPASPPSATANGFRPGRSLRVLAADPDPAARQVYQTILSALGHEVRGVGTARQALEVCRVAPPDLIIADARLPDMDGFQLAAAVGRERPVPVVLAAADPDPEAVWGAAEWHVVGYLAKPPGPRVLGAVVAAAVRSFDRLAALQDEADQLRQTLEDRKTVERAKGMVMRYTGASEEAAYRRMRRLATDRGQKLVEVARSILAAGEVFAQLVADDAPAHRDGPAHGLRSAGPRADGVANGSAAAGER